MSAERKAVFLDRDGTLIINRHYLSDPAGVELLPGAREALHRLRAEGYLLFLFTNQSGVGRGMFPLEAVHRCNDRMFELLDLPAPGFSGVCIAPESPDVPPVYRKPSPRYILEMLSLHRIAPDQAWMVGDGSADVEAGLNAGVRVARVDPTGATGPSNERFWQVRDLTDFTHRLFAPAPLSS
jgi:D-glycero-D-manno-heptose 1,7-bisphosphate phosphatase